MVEPVISTPIAPFGSQYLALENLCSIGGSEDGGIEKDEVRELVEEYTLEVQLLLP